MRKKNYKLEFTETEDSLKMNKENKGFNAFEIIGLLNLALNDLYEQIRGEEKEIEVKRTVHIDEIDKE